MLTNTLRHSYTHIHSDIQSYTLIHTRYTCSKQLACTIPSTRYDYFTLQVLQKPNAVYTVPRSKRHHNIQISRIMVRLLAINPNKQISGPPSYSSKKFRDPHFLFHPPPSPSSNLNSDLSLITNLFLRSTLNTKFPAVSCCSKAIEMTLITIVRFL